MSEPGCLSRIAAAKLIRGHGGFKEGALSVETTSLTGLPVAPLVLLVFGFPNSRGDAPGYHLSRRWRVVRP